MKIVKTTSQITEIIDLLEKHYPNPKTELENWSTPFQFLVCVILSAQATDKSVNKITGDLFGKYKDVDDFADAKLPELEKAVSSINYYKTKAKRIKDAAQFAREKMNKKLPPDIDELTKIPGIGRKSANVILHETLGASHGIVVDTHVTRVSFRLGLTSYDDQKDAEKIESELKKIVPKDKWRLYSGAIVLHGRYVCKARNPDCAGCILNKICPSAYNV